MVKLIDASNRDPAWSCDECGGSIGVAVEIGWEAPDGAIALCPDCLAKAAALLGKSRSNECVAAFEAVSGPLDDDDESLPDQPLDKETLVRLRGTNFELEDD